MKLPVLAFFLSVLFFSCSKKNDQTPVGIDRIAGHYSGGALTWEQTIEGSDKKAATDNNSSFDIVYKDKKATVTVNTTAGITNKSYQLNLISSETDQNGYIFQLLENTDQVYNNSALRVTITTATSAIIDFNKTDKSSGKTVIEKYTLSGFPQGK